jgi:hypothetical protein
MPSVAPNAADFMTQLPGAGTLAQPLAREPHESAFARLAAAGDVMQETR